MDFKNPTSMWLGSLCLLLILHTSQFTNWNPVRNWNIWQKSIRGNQQIFKHDNHLNKLNPQFNFAINISFKTKISENFQDFDGPLRFLDISEDFLDFKDLLKIPRIAKILWQKKIFRNLMKFRNICTKISMISKAFCDFKDFFKISSKPTSDFKSVEPITFWSNKKPVTIFKNCEF